DVRPAADSLRDPHLAALESAAMLVAASSTDELLHMLVQHVHLDFSAEWSAVIDAEEHEVYDGIGDVPPAAWLEAFVEGSRASAVAWSIAGVTAMSSAHPAESSSTLDQTPSASPARYAAPSAVVSGIVGRCTGTCSCPACSSRTSRFSEAPPSTRNVTIGYPD